MSDAVISRADVLRTHLEPLVKQAGSSTDPVFIAEVCQLVKRSLGELMPHHDVPMVQGHLVDQLRWFILLSARLSDPPWLEIASIGVGYSAFHAGVLDRGMRRLQHPGWTDTQRREQIDDAHGLMEAGRSVVDVAAYAWHRCGQPALAGQLVESLAGSLFDSERSVTGIRAASVDRAQQEELSRQHTEYVENFPSEDLPVARELSLDEADTLYETYFREQIDRVFALPRHLHLTAAHLLNCAPQLAAIESGRDVVYLIATSHGSTAIRYRSDRGRAAETVSIEINALTTVQTSEWIADLKKVYALYRERLINGEHLDRVLRRILDAVGTQVMAPLFAAWPDMERFALVPVGTVSALPLYTALVDGKTACVVRDFTIAPSARTLHASAMFAAQRLGSALVVADPSEGEDYLKHTVTESDGVAALYGVPVVGPRRTPPPASDPSDTPVRALRALQRQPSTGSNTLWRELDAGITRSVVHFSCHGFVSDFPSPNAYLLVGQGISLTDFLGGGRLISPGGVVVLSACSVGGVVESIPSELIGFPAVLLGAGVRTVLAPIWPVLDNADTVEFVVGLHGHMRMGLPPATALARAVGEAFDAGASSAVWGVFAAYGQ